MTESSNDDKPRRSNESKPKPIPTTYKAFPDGRILEECWDGNRAYFYAYDPHALTERDIIKSVDEFQEDNGTRYVPLLEDVLTKKIVLLPTYPARYENEFELLGEIQNYIHQWCEIDQETERLMSGYVLLTWVYEKCPTMPIINNRGRSGTGKTRLLETMRQVSYRGMRASGCLSFSSMFRTAEIWRGTLCINEGDLKNSSEKSDMVKYLNERYEKGGNVWRTNPNTLNREYFDAYGPTIITTRQHFKDDALESRCFINPMKERTRKDIYLNLPEAFYDSGQSLRNKLLYFRFKHLDTFENDYRLEFDRLSPRMNQILQPLASLARQIDNDLCEDVQQTAQSLQDRIVESMAETPDGQIVRAFLDLELDSKSERLAFTPKEISEKIGEDGGDLSPSSVGGRLSALGFELNRTGKKRLWSMPDSVRESLKMRFIPRDNDTMTPMTAKKGRGSQKSMDTYPGVSP